MFIFTTNKVVPFRDGTARSHKVPNVGEAWRLARSTEYGVSERHRS